MKKNQVKTSGIQQIQLPDTFFSNFGILDPKTVPAPPECLSSPQQASELQTVQVGLIPGPDRTQPGKQKPSNTSGRVMTF